MKEVYFKKYRYVNEILYKGACRKPPRGLRITCYFLGVPLGRRANTVPGRISHLETVRKQNHSLLRRALQLVSPEERKLAHLIYEMEMSPDEIAAVLQISKGAVYTRKHRLREKLRRALSD